MQGINNVLVVCVDRDDDLGKKIGARGPIIGKKDNLNFAAKLALADPEESDVNSMFAAVKKYEEIKNQFDNVKVVTLTGHSSRGFLADKAINEQLDVLMEKFDVEGIVLVTDGADDDQVLPILQSRAPIISKQQVIIKQAYEVESTFYTIKEALKDPFLARVVFGVPGVILIMYAAMYYFGYERFFFQAIAFILGVYLILKGTGLEEKIAIAVYNVTSPISMQRTSAPIYLGGIFIFAFGLLSAYNSYAVMIYEQDLFLAAVEALTHVVAFTAIAGLVFLLGKTIDAIHFKKAYYLGKYLLSAVFVLVMWFIILAAKEVIVANTDLNLFFVSVFISFAVVLLAYKVSLVFDVRKKITKLLVGLPVYSGKGRWIGKVSGISQSKKSITFMNVKSKKKVEVKRKEFAVRGGRVLLSA